ncbi:MAG TPA: CxxxxCH/CxxCH domain-containing protein [Kofleriaceae bacterium]|nr:CxxxxCH/CxxCH domain-containing protein [Kofleriaceae bacterium]
MLLPLVLACACEVGSVKPDGGGGGRGGDGDGTGADGGVGFAGRYHPVGFAAPEQHGPELELQAQDCRACHGEDLTGAATAQNAPSCDSCHTPSDPPAWRSDCTFCHGGDDNDTGAPPGDLGLAAGASFPGHTSHVTEGIAAAAACTECHAAVDDLLTPGHAFDDSAGVAEVELAGGRSPAGTYADGTCSNLYCHGSGRGDDGVAQVAMAAPTCAGCHPSIASSSADWSTMSGDHRRHLALGYGCEECHQTVTTDSTTIEAPLLHVDRQNQVVFLAATITYAPANRRCTGSCHGQNHDDSW